MLTKLCDFCGKEIPVNSKICPFCNKALEEKVFTYMSENKPKSDSANGLDVSKYITRTDDKPAEDYFKTNVYSYSEKEIEKTFERKDVVYDEEERENQNMRYKMQREYIPRKDGKKNNRKGNKKSNKRKHKGNKKTIVALTLVVLIIIVIISLIAFKPFSGKSDLETTSSTTGSTTTTIETTTEATTETTTVTSPSTYSPQSVDLDGYLGLSYSSFKSNFDASPRNSDSNEVSGGSNYYYDGMTISTDSDSKVVAISVDYSTASNKDTYRYQDITYYSYYDQVIDEFGEPKLNQIEDKNDRCVAYTLDVGSGLSIKFKFDDNKKVTGFDVFYTD